MPRLRRAGSTAVIALLLTAVAACSSGSSGDGLASDSALPTEIPAGTKLVIADQGERQLALLTGSGQLDALPFEYEFATFQGAPAILEAFRADAVDVAWAGEIMTVQSLVAGDDVQVVAAMQTNNSLNMGIAPNASDITTLADLKGKRIGYAEGTSQQAFVLRGLDKAGLSVDDVELVSMSLPDFPDALRSNQIDAAPMSEPAFSRCMQTPGATSLPRPEIEDLSEGISYLYSSKKALSDPATAAAVRAYVTAYITSVDWADNNRDAYIDTYFVKSQGLTAEAGERILDTSGITTFPHLDEELIATQQHTIDVINAAGELPKPVDAADAFDLRFDEVVTEAVAETGASHTRS
ncbi:ABC transporter substrate-binding protein [Rhodococcus pyridinivorans]|uniref:ABC transporter substrate-binding protein n=1 Tax=Rhodococcus pyridinivorans TaxID=103816 RepID=UPI00200B1F18|nr:ABC transporter substrate-binding protein [Rhodococcus pyridinivorans]UPW02698.1 ABC transporter substrate-binding protein [Rhodococcus pyridinivorans]